MPHMLPNISCAAHNKQNIASKRPSRNQAAVLLLIVALGFFLRVRGLDRVGFNEDEINKVQAARAYLHGDFSLNREHPMLMKSMIAISLGLSDIWNRGSGQSMQISEEIAVRLPNAQVFILPYIDSIAGFVLLFAAATILSAWFLTSSPRLSYFGIQVAVAFYLVNASEFKMQTSLAVARDRVVGILLGLFIMWLVFDQLWGAPAGVEMRKRLIANLRLLAQFAREPLSKDLKDSRARSLVLAETINSNLDAVRALADGVLFEFGLSREQDLVLRDRIRRWQPTLRTLFITHVALWRYRGQLPGFELPEAIQQAEQEFDNHLAAALEGMADRLDGNEPTPMDDWTNAYAQLEEAVWKASPQSHQLTPQIQSFLLLSRRIADLADSLKKEI